MGEIAGRFSNLSNASANRMPTTQVRFDTLPTACKAHSHRHQRRRLLSFEPLAGCCEVSCPLNNYRNEERRIAKRLATNAPHPHATATP
jgi:hypothetical protein